MRSKKQLAIFLSKLKVFSKPKISLEQYPTPSEIAATMLWDAYMKGDIEDKVVADFGCGTGILGIGALLMGASKVYFVEKDPDAIALLQENLMQLEDVSYEIVEKDVADFSEAVDSVLQNPPFGTKQKHADKPFLEKAFSLASVVYSFHKTTTSGFVRAVAKDHGFRVAETIDFAFPLRNTMKQHKKRISRIEVTCYRFAKAKL